LIARGGCRKGRMIRSGAICPKINPGRTVIEALIGLGSAGARLPDILARLLDELFRAMLEEPMSGRLPAGALVRRRPELAPRANLPIPACLQAAKCPSLPGAEGFQALPRV